MNAKSSKAKLNQRPAKRSGSNQKKRERGGPDSESRSGDIATLILRDHKPLKELIMILKDPEVTIAKKRPAFAEFERTLSAHAKAEEESLYVHLKQEDDLRAEGLEGDTEHAIADRLMMEVNESKGDDDLWMAKVKVLAEVVDHHVKEEEKELLKEVRKEFSSDERLEIGEIYSRLLNKYRDDGGKQKKFNGKEEMRAEYV